MPDDKTTTSPEATLPTPGLEPDGQAHHIADEPVGEVETGEPTVRSPVTDTGLPVEEQIDKQWDSNKDGGLPTFLNTQRA